MNEHDATIHFELSSGQRKSDLLVQDCLDGLAKMLHNGFVEINGDSYPIKVIAQDGKIMLDVKGLPGFDHIEFCITKTGWGRLV